MSIAWRLMSQSPTWISLSKGKIFSDFQFVVTIASSGNSKNFQQSFFKDEYDIFWVFYISCIVQKSCFNFMNILKYRDWYWYFDKFLEIFHKFWKQLIFSWNLERVLGDRFSKINLKNLISLLLKPSDNKELKSGIILYHLFMRWCINFYTLVRKFTYKKHRNFCVKNGSYNQKL